jgi:hypothetical protein
MSPPIGGMRRARAFAILLVTTDESVMRLPPLRHVLVRSYPQPRRESIPRPSRYVDQAISITKKASVSSKVPDRSAGAAWTHCGSKVRRRAILELLVLRTRFHRNVTANDLRAPIIGKYKHRQQR